MSEILLTIGLLAALLCWVLTNAEQGKRCKEEREQWNKERQQLLDRIQAPSFAEFKTGEVRMIKAQKDEQPKPQVELL